MNTNQEDKIHGKLDFHAVTDNIYVGTNACCQVHFDEKLIALGVSADISLEEERIDAPFGVPHFLWLPTTDHTPPSPDQLEHGLRSLRFFAEKGIKCYVHCKNGHGRAPTLVAAYLIADKNMSTDKAIAFMKEKRPSVHYEPSQIEALKRWEEGLKK